MKVTSPGDLDRRITLQTPTRVPDGGGGFVDTWKDIATVWAKKTTHRSDEAVQAMAETGKATHNFRIRYRTDIKASWRIKESGKYMALIGPPIEVVRREWMDITVREATT
jgi:SPP1 family predicted phage head-tail adaptor